MPAKKNYLVISALGKDRPGIVDKLSKIILEDECNIVDSRMTVLGGEFAILLMVEGNWNTLTKLEDALPKQGAKLGLTIISKRTDERQSGSKTLPYAIDVVAMDHPGIVHHLANFFSERNINIEDLITSSYAAAHTGTPMFSVRMSISIPAEMHIAGLRDDFLEFCDGMNLDAAMDPIKG